MNDLTGFCNNTAQNTSTAYDIQGRCAQSLPSIYRPLEP